MLSVVPGKELHGAALTAGVCVAFLTAPAKQTLNALLAFLYKMENPLKIFFG